MTANELEVLEHYKRKIVKYIDSPEVLLKCLGKLDQVRVNIDLLGRTGIGMTVNALKKKYGDSDVGALSRDLVIKWKAVVAREDQEREQEEAEAENDDEEDQQGHSEPEYHPTPIDSHENGNGSSENDNEPENEEVDDSSQDEGHHSRKSKKKKSHREKRPDEKESREHKSDKHHKNKKDKEKERDREKSHKHKHSDKDRERELKHHKSDKERSKEHKSSKSSHRDRSRDRDSTKEAVKKEKCDKRDELGSDDREQGDSKRKYRTSDSAGSSSSSRKHDNQKELKNGSKSDDKHLKSKHQQRDLSSIDIFSNNLENSDNRSSSSRKRPTVDELEGNSRTKQPKLLSSDHKPSLPSLPSSLMSSGPSLIPDISPIYKPLPRPNLNMVDKQSIQNDKNDIDLSFLLNNKNKGRAAIYSGAKRKGFFGAVPSLFDQCIQVLKENVEFIEEVGGLPYEILEPVLSMANEETLLRIEDCNPHLMEDTGKLWEKIVKKRWPKKDKFGEYVVKREEMESWREMYERCTEEQAEKLARLRGQISGQVKKDQEGLKKTKLAYVDIAPKAPRSVRNAQIKHGTALPSGTPLVAGGPRPRNQISDPTANASRAYVAPKKPKTAPLMAKTFKLMRGIKGGFRR